MQSKEQADLALTVAMQLAPPSPTTVEIVAAVAHCGGLSAILGQPTDDERAAVYESIGVSAVYNPERNQVRLAADPVASTVCRRGDLSAGATRFGSPEWCRWRRNRSPFRSLTTSCWSRCAIACAAAIGLARSV